MKSTKLDSQQVDGLPKIYKELCFILNYVNNGLKAIQKRFEIQNWKSIMSSDVQYKHIVEDFQILGYDIRSGRKNILNMIAMHSGNKKDKLLREAISNSKTDSAILLPPLLSSTRGLYIPKFWKNTNKLNERSLKEQDLKDDQLLHKAQQIMEQRELETRQKEFEHEKQIKEIQLQEERLMKLKIEEEVNTQVMKKLQQEGLKSMKRDKMKDKTHLEKRKEKFKKPNIPSSTGSNYKSTIESQNNGARRSFDLTRHRSTYKRDAAQNTNRSKTSMRRSLELQNNRILSSMENDERKKSNEASINKAALTAWSTFTQERSKDLEYTSHSEAQKTNEIGSHNKQSKPRMLNEIKSRPTLKANKFVKLSDRNLTRTKITVQSSPKIKPLIKSNKNLNISSSNNDSNEINDRTDGIEVSIINHIKSNILVLDENVYWDDVAGLSAVKKSLKETVVYPFLGPDLFKGLREPIRGMLLFGPPGTGKTMIAKAIATESNCTFFSVSASSLLSKYLGESEKLVKALFYMAKKMTPSIIFIDEIDSILGSRNDNENESSRRIKTEVLIQWSALSKASVNDSKYPAQRVLVLGATNIPWIIDDAARRRFSRRLYVPLPDYETRLYHLKRLLRKQQNDLSEEDLNHITTLTKGYSGSDITALAKEAAMEPIRELGDKLVDITFESIRDIGRKDFIIAMETIKKSVSGDNLERFEDWAREYGSMGS